MIKLLVVCLCIYGAVCTPLHSYEILDDVENEAEIIDAAEILKGTNNLHEKSVPVMRLATPTGLYLYGKKNLAERAQVPYHLAPAYLPGTRNLEEKAISDQVISRMSFWHPKSEVETFN